MTLRAQKSTSGGFAKADRLADFSGGFGAFSICFFWLFCGVLLCFLLVFFFLFEVFWMFSFWLVWWSQDPKSHQKPPVSRGPPRVCPSGFLASDPAWISSVRLAAGSCGANGESGRKETSTGRA